MSEYEQRITIDAGGKRIFDFISNVQNMPKYLPTVQEAQTQPGDRVRVIGEVDGHKYDADGYFRTDRERLRMDWGSDGEIQYRGWMLVAGNEAGSRSEVTVHLSFEPPDQMKHRFEEKTGDRHTAIQQGLQNALRSIKSFCEVGQGATKTGEAA